MYDDGSEEILKGCKCGNRLFYFISDKKIKKEQPEIMDGTEQELTDDDQEQDMIMLDTEAVNIVEYGKYEIDINALLGDDGLVYRFGDGKWIRLFDMRYHRLG